MIIDLFKTSILRTKLKDDSLNSIILNKLEIYKKNNKSRVITNVLGFQSEDIKDKDWDVIVLTPRGDMVPQDTSLKEYGFLRIKNHQTMTGYIVKTNFLKNRKLLIDNFIKIVKNRSVKIEKSTKIEKKSIAIFHFFKKSKTTVLKIS